MASLGQLGLAVPVGEDGPWAELVRPVATGIPWSALSLSRAGAGGDETSARWCGAETSQDLPPGALGTAVQDEIFAGSGRNSRLSFGLVLLLLIFLNCG